MSTIEFEVTPEVMELIKRRKELIAASAQNEIADPLQWIDDYHRNNFELAHALDLGIRKAIRV